MAITKELGFGGGRGGGGLLGGFLQVGEMSKILANGVGNLETSETGSSTRLLYT